MKAVLCQLIIHRYEQSVDQQLQALRVFVRIVEAGSFAKAADSLKVPRATATKLIQELESHLRAKLLHRTTRNVSVTAEGNAYYERATRLLSELEDADASIGRSQAELTGRIRVHVAATVANLVLIPTLHRFHERCPQVQIDLGISDRRVNMIEDGIDCVIRGGDLSDSSLIGRRVAELAWVTCASRSYLERHGTPRHPSELENAYDVVHYASALTGRVAPIRLSRGTERLEITGQARLSVNEGTAHLTALLAGQGIGQTLSFMARAGLESGELVELFPSWSLAPESLHALYPANRHLSAKVRAFIDWTSELFAEISTRPV